MNPVSIIPVLIAIAIALLTVKIISKIKGVKPAEVKYTTIDGLRGYLAFLVFMHHSVVWYFFLRTSEWNVPPTNLFIHFGQTSVALFFMVTGFLFFLKLNSPREKQVDWLHLFVSRIMRLFPLYLIAISALVIIVFILSHFQIKESFLNIFKEIAGWTLFTVYSAHPINHYEFTSIIVAGVVWSLVYEWIFYLSLPIIGILFFRKKASIFTIVITVLLLISIVMRQDLNKIHFYTFAGGIIAAFLVRSNKFCQLATKRIFSLVIIICLAAAVYFFRSPQAIVPLILISIPFILIACGNTLFGILALPISRLLGQMAYSIYLLHGMVLFVCFKFVFGFDFISKTSPIFYWTIIFGCTVALIIICNLSYHYIELPSMNSSSKITNFIKNKFQIIKLRIKAIANK
ncbi:MAG: acyltransferase [Bacteroidota bacterium]